MKLNKTDINSFLIGFAEGIKDRGAYIQNKSNRMIECRMKGHEVAEAFLKDAALGYAPGLTLGDYIDAALEELGAVQP